MDNGNPIRLRGGVVTLLDPKHGAETSFNRYYEGERFFTAVMLGPGVISGRRFVARREEKEQRRIFDPSLTKERGSLLNVYWVVGETKTLEEWTVQTVARLEAEGRTNWDRVPYWAWRPSFAWSQTAPPDRIPAELALNHDYQGLVMALVRPKDPAHIGEAAAWYQSECAAQTIGDGSPSKLCVAFEARRRFVPGAPGETTPKDFPTEDVQLLLFWFLEDPPDDSWKVIADRHEAGLRATDLMSPTWMSPFIATVPGTDRYMDSLWLTEDS
jgi:hypothetical protein